MPCDMDFAKIEKKMRKSDRRLLPSDLTDLIKSCVVKAEWNLVYLAHPFTDNLKHDRTELVKVKAFKKRLRT